MSRRPTASLDAFDEHLESRTRNPSSSGTDYSSPLSADRLRLCFVTTSLDVGGAETTLVGVVADLAGRGHSVQVIALRGTGRLVQQLDQIGVPTVVLHVSNLAKALSGLRRAIGLARRHRPQVVQGWMYHGNLFATAVAVACGARLVWGIRQSLAALDQENMTTNRLITLGAWISRWPSAIVYASRSALRDHEKAGYFAGNGEVIPNGVDLDRFQRSADQRGAWRRRLSIPPDAPLVGMVARLHPVKDLATFLRGAADVLRSFPTARFVLAGRGLEPSNETLMRRITDMGLRDRLALLGEVNDVPGLMSALDVLCLSSRSEAFPNVLLEGLACEVPCASTDVGDATDIIDGSGEVVPVGDAEALGAAVRRLLALPCDHRAALGQAARRRMADNFSVTACATKYGELYRACLARR